MDHDLYSYSDDWHGRLCRSSLDGLYDCWSNQSVSRNQIGICQNCRVQIFGWNYIFMWKKNLHTYFDGRPISVLLGPVSRTVVSTVAIQLVWRKVWAILALYIEACIGWDYHFRLVWKNRQSVGWDYHLTTLNLNETSGNRGGKNRATEHQFS